MAGDYWFRPKMFGWGITPVTWQGWTMTAGLIAALIATSRLPSRTEQVIVAVVLATAFLVIAAGKTKGGWRWRWGGD